MDMRSQLQKYTYRWIKMPTSAQCHCGDAGILWAITLVYWSIFYGCVSKSIGLGQRCPFEYMSGRTVTIWFRHSSRSPQLFCFMSSPSIHIPVFQLSHGRPGFFLELRCYQPQMSGMLKYVSQDSAATDLRGGGSCNSVFLHRSFLNVAVKKYGNRSTVAEVIITRSSADADNALDANEAVIRVIRGVPNFRKSITWPRPRPLRGRFVVRTQ